MIGIAELQEKIYLTDLKQPYPSRNGGYPIGWTCNFEKPHNYRKTLYLKAFGVADYGVDIGFSEFKMAYPIWRTLYFGKLTIIVELCTPRFLRSLITNLTLDFRNSKCITMIRDIFS